MKKRMILALALFLAGFQLMNAIPAYPGKYVYTQPDGKRHRMHCYIYGEALNHDVLFFGPNKDLTFKNIHDALIVSCLDDPTSVNKVIADVLRYVIADYKQQQLDIQKKIDKLSEKLGELL